jgi:hypothetical protein
MRFKAVIPSWIPAPDMKRRTQGIVPATNKAAILSKQWAGPNDSKKSRILFFLSKYRYFYDILNELSIKMANIN